MRPLIGVLTAKCSSPEMQTMGTKCERPERNNLSGRVHSGFSPRDELALLAERDNAECAVAVVIVASRKEELIRIAVRPSQSALTELDRPDIIDLNRFSACVAQRTKESAGLRIKGVDAPVRSVICDEKRIAHGSKVGRRQCHAPRRVQRTAYRKMSLQNARRRERIDKTALRFVQRGVSNPNGFRAVRIGDGLNAIRREFLRNLGVHKSVLTIDELEIGIEYVDPAILSVIGGVQKLLSVVGGNSQSCVRGTGG